LLMGSGAETAQETVEAAQRAGGGGLLKVACFARSITPP